jgi:hypothetical protein
MATLCLSVVQIACIRSNIESEDEPCAPVGISTEAASFPDASSIRYVLDVPSGVTLCVIDPSNDDDLGWPVDLQPAANHQVSGVLPVNPPRLFRKVDLGLPHPNRAGGINLAPGEAFRSIDIAPGEYRLVLRYRTGRCNRRYFDRVCTTTSEPFQLEQRMRFWRER